MLSLDKTNVAINYIDQAIVLNGNYDTLGGLLTLIKFGDLIPARDALIAGLNEPNFVIDDDNIKKGTLVE